MNDHTHTKPVAKIWDHLRDGHNAVLSTLSDLQRAHDALHAGTAIIVYLVEEYKVDYDDYQIGQARTLFVTADNQRADEATGWNKDYRYRTNRRKTAMVVEDIGDIT